MFIQFHGTPTLDRDAEPLPAAKTGTEKGAVAVPGAVVPSADTGAELAVRPAAPIPIVYLVDPVVTSGPYGRHSELSLVDTLPILASSSPTHNTLC